MLAPATLRPAFSRAARKIARDPLGFAVQTIRAFRANQGLLLAGGVAYYTLLSIVPLMILLVIILSHVDRRGTAHVDARAIPAGSWFPASRAR